MCVHRKRPQDDTAGPSKVKKNKALKKKKTPKKKKNTTEKEAEKRCCSSSARVVRSLMDLLSDGQ